MTLTETDKQLDTRTFTDRGLAASADRILQAAKATGRPYLDDPDLAVAYQGERGTFTNVAYVLAPPADWNDVLARVTAIVPRGRPVSLISASTTPDLGGSEWSLVGHPPFMVRPVSDSPSITVPVELTISEAADQPGLEVFERTLVDAFPDPGLQPYEWGSNLDERALGNGTHFFTGLVAGAPVATAAAHVAAGVNLVEMVSTMAGARGRGYGEALTWAATLADPSLPAVLIASDLGRPIYERMGFLPVTRWTFWHRA